MLRVPAKIHEFVLDERGTPSIEYALIAFAIAATIAGIVYILGDEVKAMWGEIGDDVSSKLGS